MHIGEERQPKSEIRDEGSNFENVLPMGRYNNRNQRPCRDPLGS